MQIIAIWVPEEHYEDVKTHAKSWLFDMLKATTATLFKCDWKSVRVDIVSVCSSDPDSIFIHCRATKNPQTHGKSDIWCAQLLQTFRTGDISDQAYSVLNGITVQIYCEVVPDAKYDEVRIPKMVVT